MENKELFKDIPNTRLAYYLLRQTHTHHMNLSMMADQKANIIIAATAIIFTFSLNRIDVDNLIWGLLILTIFSFVSLIFAVRSVIPRFSRKKNVEICNKEFNPLFFGFFTSLSMDEYYEHMDDILRNEEKVIQATVRDIYQLGNVLHKKKYKFLTNSYVTFFCGLILSAVALLIQYLLFS